MKDENHLSLLLICKGLHLFPDMTMDSFFARLQLEHSHLSVSGPGSTAMSRLRLVGLRENKTVDYLTLVHKSDTAKDSP